MTKTEFILKTKGSAAEVVAAAKKQKIKITEAYVYSVRSAKKAKVSFGGRSRPKAKSKTGKALSKSTVQTLGSIRADENAERMFCSLAADIGRSRSKELLDKVFQAGASIV